MLYRNYKQALLSLAIVSLLGAGVVSSVSAAGIGAGRTERGSSKKAAEEVKYPQATRVEPKEKASTKMQGKLNKLFQAYNEDGKEDEMLTLANEILNDPKANNYDKSVSAQLAAQAAYNKDDSAQAKTYLNQALELNGLDNNGHYQSMFFLGQLQLQDDENDKALATFNRFFDETHSQNPDELIVKGQLLYNMQRYDEAIPVLKQAIDGSTDPKDSWNQLLMASYAEAGQTGAALAVAEQNAAKNPNDKRAQLNLASVYMQAEQMDKAAATMEKLRASGQLTEEREYRQLYSTYANMDGREKDVISVIEEGKAKGILKDDYQTNLALAQSYYYSEQIPQAIAAWQKAAPLSPNGETYLNLARVLWQEDRVPEAKKAAQAALDKGGLKNPADAKKILALP